MVESKKPKTQPDLGKAQASIGILCLSYAELTQELKLIWISSNHSLAVNVSITEEPGAGIPHAGICAGCIR